MYNGLLNFKGDNNDDILEENSGGGSSSSTRSSSLGGLFGVSFQQPQDEGHVAQKPTALIASTQTQVNGSKDKSNWNVCITKVVTAFKSVNEQNVLQGKLGLALLSSGNAGKIILYRNKENVLSSMVVKTNSALFVKQGYLQYHDDLEIYWSLMFAKDLDRDEFITHIEKFNGTVLRTASEESTETVKKVIDDGASTAISVVDGKEAVVSRIARVGQQLPKLEPAKGTRNDDDLLSPSPSAPKEIIRNESTFQSVTDTVARSTDQQPFHSPSNKLAQYLQQNNTNANINNFLTESRVHNSEIRINISKLDAKIDHVLEKVDLLRDRNATTDDDKDDEILRLEEKLVDVRRENRALKLKVLTLEKTEPNAPIDLFKKESAETQAILGTQINEARQTIEVLQKQKGDRDKEIEDLRAQIEQKDHELKQLKAETVRRNETNETQPKIGPKESSTDAQNAEVIRGIMNDFYHKLFTNLNNQTNWSTKDVLKLSVDLIREETKAALSRQQ